MALQLLPSFGSRGSDLGLNRMTVDIEDTSYRSQYFDVIEIASLFTAGRNPIGFNGTNNLLSGSPILVQCLDSAGNSLFIETPSGPTTYTDSSKFLVSVSVFDETANGQGKLFLVATSSNKEIVRWSTNITIDKTVQNSAKVRFYSTPTIEARSLLYPVIASGIGSSLTIPVTFTGSMSTIALTPARDTNQKLINPKQMDIDYRVFLNIPDSVAVVPQLYQTNSFNSQMVGQSITIQATGVQQPLSYKTIPSTKTGSFTVKSVIDTKTLQLSNVFLYPYHSNQLVANITVGNFTASYTWAAYNTASAAYQIYTPISGSPIFIKQSFAEVVYRNLNTFSGFVARHKLYRQSLVYPGGFQLIVDEPLGAEELLTDPISANQAYNLIGTFYNQIHINNYWYPFTGSGTPLALSASVRPLINSMTIAAPAGVFPNGSGYVIAKTSSPNTVNDNVYYPYNTASFNDLTGSAYASNFIALKAGALYVLSTNVIMQKPQTATDSKVSFYFTSSIPAILIEKNYVNPFGLLMGQVTCSDSVTTKTFGDKQMMFFTPQADYFGTVIIVPTDCNVTLSELSLQVYGDSGFSPDIMFTRIPFSINVANEGFTLKAELYDVNSVLIFEKLQTVASFDPNGESLFQFIPSSNVDPSKVQFISGSLTISESLFLPNIPSCPSVDTRLLAWRLPSHTPPRNTDGQVCFTDIAELEIDSTGAGSSVVGDYLTVGTVAFSGSSLIQSTVTALSVKYDGASNQGRKIIVNNSGSKTTYP